MYHPLLGSWLSRDPLGLAANDQNVYRYAGSNPANGTDPQGLKVFLACSEARRAGVNVGLHCAIVVECGKRTVKYDGGGGSLSGTRKKSEENPEGLPQPKRHEPSNDRPTDMRFALESSWWPCCEDEIKCLDNAYDKIKQLPYHATGPNSNSYAHALLRACCIRFKEYVREIPWEERIHRSLYDLLFTSEETVTAQSLFEGWDSIEGYPEKVDGGPERPRVCRQ